MIFNFFRKNRILQSDLELLGAIINKLPHQYSYLKRQLNNDFILGKEKNQLGQKGTYNFTLNAKLEAKYSSKELPNYFLIKNIQVWNMKRNSYDEFDIQVLEGMLAGYYTPHDLKELDSKKIVSDHIYEKHFQDDEKNELQNIVRGGLKEIESVLDLSETFKMEIPEGEFYVIKNLGDGNYISVNKDGAIYGMIHDPYEIEKIFDNPTDFKAAIVSGLFDIKKYYESKMSNSD